MWNTSSLVSNMNSRPLCLYSKVGDRSRGSTKGSLFKTTTPWCRRGCYSISGISPLYPWVQSKAELSTIFWVFGTTRPGIETWSPGPLANTRVWNFIYDHYSDQSYDTKLHLVLRLRFWSFEDCSVSTKLPLLPDPLWVVVSVWVPSMSKIDVLKIY